MSVKTMVAMLLTVLGVVAIACGDAAIRSRQSVAGIGTPHVTAEGAHPIPLSPIAGILAVGAGVVLFVFDVRKLVPATVRS
jgi:hypothetical protein